MRQALARGHTAGRLAQRGLFLQLVLRIMVTSSLSCYQNTTDGASSAHFLAHGSELESKTKVLATGLSTKTLLLPCGQLLLAGRPMALSSLPSTCIGTKPSGSSWS